MKLFSPAYWPTEPMDWPCQCPAGAALGGTPTYLSVCAVAVHGVDVKIGGVGLGREAVVADVDPYPLNAHVLDVERVEEVRVLGQHLRIVGPGRTDDVLERDMLGWASGQPRVSSRPRPRPPRPCHAHT